MCYYRDKQTTNKFQIAKVTSEGVSVSDPFALETQWGYQVRTFALLISILRCQGSAANVLVGASGDAGVCQPFGKCAWHLVKSWCPACSSMEQPCVWTFTTRWMPCWGNYKKRNHSPTTLALTTLASTHCHAPAA